MKKLTITLALALLVSCVSTSALAAPVSGGSSYKCNVISSKSGCTPSSFGSGTVAGTGANALCDGLKIFGCANGAGGNGQDCGLQQSAKALQGCNLSEDLLRSFGLCETGKSNGTSCDEPAAAARIASRPNRPPLRQPRKQRPPLRTTTPPP